MMENMMLLWFMKYEKLFQLIWNVNPYTVNLLFTLLMGVLDSTEIWKIAIIFVSTEVILNWMRNGHFLPLVMVNNHVME